MANVYGYRIEILEDPDSYYTDRGYIFADSLRSAVDKLFKEYKCEEKNVYDFEIFDCAPEDNDVYSIYTLLCDSSFSDSKLKLTNELKGWSLI